MRCRPNNCGLLELRKDARNKKKVNMIVKKRVKRMNGKKAKLLTRWIASQKSINSSPKSVVVHRGMLSSRHSSRGDNSSQMLKVQSQLEAMILLTMHRTRTSTESPANKEIRAEVIRIRDQDEDVLIKKGKREEKDVATEMKIIKVLMVEIGRDVRGQDKGKAKPDRAVIVASKETVMVIVMGTTEVNRVEREEDVIGEKKGMRKETWIDKSQQDSRDQVEECRISRKLENRSSIIIKDLVEVQLLLVFMLLN